MALAAGNLVGTRDATSRGVSLVTPRRIATVAAFLIGLLALPVTAAPPTHLFDIQRSKNANVVRYDLRLERPGRYDVRKPIDAYWVLLEHAGQREELSPLERSLAYGYRILPGATNRVLPIRLVAVPGRVVSIRLRSGHYRPELPISGEPSILRRVYVKTKERRPLPRVIYVDLHGKSIASGRPTFERLVRD